MESVLTEKVYFHITIRYMHKMDYLSYRNISASKYREKERVAFEHRIGQEGHK